MPVKMDIVARERGWRCDGIANGSFDAEGRVLLRVHRRTVPRVKRNIHISESG